MRQFDEEGIARELARRTPTHEICTRFEIMPQALHRLQARPDFIRKFEFFIERNAALRTAQHELIQELTGTALRQLEADLSDHDDKVRRKAAEHFAVPAIQAFHKSQEIREQAQATVDIHTALTIHESLNEIRTIVHGLPPIEIEAQSEP